MITQEIINSSSIIKQNQEIFDLVNQKTACALISIRNLIAKNPDIANSSQEFLDLYKFIFDCDQDIFSNVWIDPTTFFWVHSTYELIKNKFTNQTFSTPIQLYFDELKKQNIENSLDFQINEFKKIVLAIAHLSQEDYTFIKPLNITLPFAIPATPIYIATDAEKKAQIYSIKNNIINIKVNEKYYNFDLNKQYSVDNIILAHCPTITHNSHQFRLQIYSLNIPGFSESNAVFKTGISYQEKHSNFLKETLDIIQYYQPEIYKQIAEFLEIICLKPLKVGSYTNLSYSDIPRTIICGVIKNPFEFADSIIHEFFHNRLFCIEEIQPIIKRTQEQINQQYYSPWRNDLRPTTGILHGIYVYLAVSHFWLEVYEKNEVTKEILDYASSQITKIALQIKVGISQLNKYGDFTEFGKQFFEFIKQDFDIINNKIDKLNLSFSSPSLVCQEEGKIISEKSHFEEKQLTAKESIIEHIKRFDIHNQSQEILEIIK